MKGGERLAEVLLSVVAHHERQGGHHPCEQLARYDTPAELQAGHLRESPLRPCGDGHPVTAESSHTISAVAGLEPGAVTG
jgi:hypothetical protein